MRRLSFERCPVCNSLGNHYYNDIDDTVFGVPGKWSMKLCVHAQCGMLWLDPAPAPEDVHQAYQSYYTHGDSAAPSRRKSTTHSLYHLIQNAYLYQRYGYRSLSSRFFSFLFSPAALLTPYGQESLGVEVMFLDAPKTGNRLLEIGCGDGRSLRLMRSLGWNVEAIEFDPACVAELSKHHIKVHPGDIRSAQLIANTFDAIYLGNVIEHVYQPTSFLLECLRILKPGGRIILLTPNSQSWGHRHYKCDWRGLEPPRHIQVFNSRNLNKLLIDLGFAKVFTRTTNRGAWYILGASAEIRKSRSHNESYAASRVTRLSLRSILFQLWGNLLTKISPSLGEEILLTACKPK